MHGRGNCTPGAEPGQRISPLHEAKGQTRVENSLVRGGGGTKQVGPGKQVKGHIVSALLGKTQDYLGFHGIRLQAEMVIFFISSLTDNS